MLSAGPVADHLMRPALTASSMDLSLDVPPKYQIFGSSDVRASYGRLVGQAGIEGSF